MKLIQPRLFPLVLTLALTTLLNCGKITPSTEYTDLITLSDDWQQFEKPSLNNGMPDYSQEAMRRQKNAIPLFEKRLKAIYTGQWPITQKVDWAILQAEINGLRFNHDVLRPWSKNPLFYVVIQMDEADVPDREWPEMSTVMNVFNHEFPLNADSKAIFTSKLKAVPAVMTQAKENLTELTDYFVAFGIQAHERASKDLKTLIYSLQNEAELTMLAVTAKKAVDEFILWLKDDNSHCPAYQGIGKAAFNRYMKEVHLVPYNWDEQLLLLNRELQRSLAGLAMEEQRNRHLPQILPASTLAELRQRIDTAISQFMAFLDTETIFTLPDYMHLEFPVNRLIPEEQLDFFYHILYRDPLPLICHQVHWLEKQRELHNLHPIRGQALLSKIWDSRAEGLATGFEELMMQAGLMKDNHRGRELNYIMLAFRAVRAIAALKLHANEMTLEEAMAWGSRNTPRHYAGQDSPMLYGDYALYLSQPGYGCSYIIGKIQLDKLIADRRSQLGDAFTLKLFLDDYFARGVIPASLLRWEITGLDDEVKRLR
ncbi:DUF885 family protein [bacterium]|nr:DUF885 family protein [bacterium]